jgi:hypothetical protein
MADIAINPVTRRVQFTGNTGTGPFAFTFNILQASDIVVYKNNVLQTLTTDYTVTINANGTGSITMVSALVATDVLIIVGGRELSRTTDFVTSGDLLAASLNEQLDSNVIMSQQLDERISRAVRSQPGDELMDLYLPLKADRADKVLSFDTEGNVQAQAASDLFSGSILGANYVNNTATGDGATVAFGVTVAPGSKNNIQIYIDGVYQNKATFSISGTTVTFSEAPPLNAAIEFIIGSAVTSISGDANGITYTQGATGSQQRTVENKLQEFVSVKDFGAVGDGVTDDTAAIQAAVDSGATSVLLCGGTSIVNGTITIPAGVTLKGQSVISEYFPTGPGSANVGSTLVKPSGGTAGPIVILQSSSGLENCYLKHLKTGGATTGIIQVGLTGANSTYNSHITNVHLYGDLTADLSGSTTCYGIFYPDGEVTPNTYQRYFNRSSDFYITNCDVAIRLGANCNGNVFTGFVTRQCYQHFLLDGVASNQQCAENVFSSFVASNIGALPTSATTVFNLKNYALFNVFNGYTTEANGAAFNIDATSVYNVFDGNENEIISSFVPPGGITGIANGSRWDTYARPQNIEQYTNMILPGLTTGAKYDLGVAGSRQSMMQAVSAGTDGLPALNGSGTLVAATAHSRVILQLNPTVFKKTAQPNFRGKLTLWVSGAATATHMASIEFGYIVSNAGTNAGLFEVYEVNMTPSASNFISGLKFISGATAGTGMRIAMVGGNLTATPAQFVTAALDLDVFAPVGYARDTYFQHTFISTAATADDVTDAVDMLTVGETAV